ncbi:MAG: NAD(P)/FAD-dependent oxidoreductase [Actinobacteria bacterium]|nr:NAD(P)/FAD-dependent oxidoreductase [Actinomycetota bacterium]
MELAQSTAAHPPDTAPTAARQRVVIVGGGFGGLKLAQDLVDDPVDITLVDRRNFHTFQPLLYQVATAMLDPGAIARSLRAILQDHDNVAVRLATVVGVDWERSEVRTAEDDRIPFDVLVLATGAVTSHYGIPGVEEHAFPLKSTDEALRLRSHVLACFEQADADPSLLDEGVLTFVVVGGGPTGVELAGALTELIGRVLRKDFPRVDVERARVVLVEATDHLLGGFGRSSQDNAYQTLRSRGVEVRLGEKVIGASATGVDLGHEVIPTRTLVWTAGVRANPLADALGLAQTAGGRIVVDDDLSVPGRPEVYVIGDLAAGRDADGGLHPQMAGVAQQGAVHVARQLRRRREGLGPTPFEYKNKGIMATIGRNAAVVEVPGGLRFRGRLAWVMWLALHLQRLVGFRNRWEVLSQWAWNYVSYDRTARLMVDAADDLPPRDDGSGSPPRPVPPVPRTRSEV